MVGKGHVSNTYANAQGIWHAEIEAAAGCGEQEVYGATMATVRRRAAKAIKAEIDARQSSTSPTVRVEFLGLFQRNNSLVALFKEV